MDLLAKKGSKTVPSRPHHNLLNGKGLSNWFHGYSLVSFLFNAQSNIVVREFCSVVDGM